MTLRPLEVVLAKPRGFCAGVARAIEIVERALGVYGATIARLSASRPVAILSREGVEERVAFRLPARLADTDARFREAAHA